MTWEAAGGLGLAQSWESVREILERCKAEKLESGCGVACSWDLQEANGLVGRLGG